MAIIAISLSLAKKVENSAGTSEAYSNRRSKENKYSCGAGFMPNYDPYALDVDQRRSCYSCEEFGYLVRNYRNQKIVGWRLEYRNERDDLKENESPVVLN